ncbi:MAG TPA: fibronectin type III domain-containing protein, partial [Acidimicrobiales bacterium]|nr:fibronectin type III domain-containing protein [Acidimicrobiales bacterium]
IEPETPDASAGPAFLPDPDPTNASPVVISHVKYSLVRNVVWVNAQGYTSSSTTTTFLQAYKRITAQVSWTDAVGPHTVRQDSIVYPGGLGSYAGPEGATTTTSTTTAAAAPCAPVLSASLPDGTAAQTQVNLSWTQPAGCGAVIGYTVQYSTSSSFPAGSTQYINGIGPGTVSYNVSGLSSSTTYWFQVVATGSGGTSATSNTASQTTAAASVPCSLNSLTVTGNTSKSTTGTIEGHTGNTAYMSENLTLVLSTSGTCTDSYAVSGTPPGGGSDQGSPYALSGSGGTYTTTVPSANETNWVLGAHTFRVLDNGASTSTLYAFDVCKFSSKSCP